MKTRCPHCRQLAPVRTSHDLSLTMREIVFTCRNHLCGHVWVAVLEDVRTLSPSAVPNLSVKLPLSPHIDQQKLQLSLFPA
ncbi:MAG: ogr/Delta-like zinc finger family protein [Burkholderiaceae bacterium]